MELIPETSPKTKTELGSLSKANYYSCHVCFSATDNTMPPVQIPFYNSISAKLPRYANRRTPTVLSNALNVKGGVIPITEGGSWDRYFANDIVLSYFKTELADHVINTVIGHPEARVLMEEDSNVWDEIVERLYTGRRWGTKSQKLNLSLTIREKRLSIRKLAVAIYNTNPSYQEGIIVQGRHNDIGLAYMIARCMAKNTPESQQEPDKTIAMYFDFKYEFFLPAGTVKVNRNDAVIPGGVYFYCKEEPAKGCQLTKGRYHRHSNVLGVVGEAMDLSAEHIQLLSETDIDVSKGAWLSLPSDKVFHITGNRGRELCLIDNPSTPVKSTLAAKAEYKDLAGETYLQQTSTKDLLDLEKFDVNTLNHMAENTLARSGLSHKKKNALKKKIILYNEVPNEGLGIGATGNGSNRYGLALMRALQNADNSSARIRKSNNALYPPSMLSPEEHNTVELESVAMVQDTRDTFRGVRFEITSVITKRVVAVQDIKAGTILGQFKAPSEDGREHTAKVYRVSDKLKWSSLGYPLTFTLTITQKPKWWPSNGRKTDFDNRPKTEEHLRKRIFELQYEGLPDWSDGNPHDFSYRYQPIYQWLNIDTGDPNLSIDVDGTVYANCDIKKEQELTVNPMAPTGEVIYYSTSQYDELLNDEFTPNYKTFVEQAEGFVVAGICYNTGDTIKTYNFTQYILPRGTIKERFEALRREIVSDKLTRESVIDNYSDCRIVDKDDAVYNEIDNLYGRMLMIIVRQLLYDRHKNMRTIHEDELDEEAMASLVRLGEYHELEYDEDNGEFSNTNQSRALFLKRLKTLPYTVPSTEHINSIRRKNGSYKLDKIVVDSAIETRPIVTERAVKAMAIYLAAKYPDERDRPSVAEFMTKCLTRRPLAFLDAGDTYLTRYSESDTEFFQPGKPGTDTDLYITYEEAIFSAMLGVSVLTPFINYGGRQSKFFYTRVSGVWLIICCRRREVTHGGRSPSRNDRVSGWTSRR